MKLYDWREAEKAQKKYCGANGLPCFAPPGGICFGCGKPIYTARVGTDGTITGYDIFTSGGKLITSCPHCHKSFVE